MKYLVALLLTMVSLTSDAQITVKPSVENFLKRDIFGEMKLSPTGEYLAATVPLEDRTDLVILRVSDLQKTGYVRVQTKRLITSFNWVNPTRIIFSMAQYEFRGVGVALEPLGGLYGVNADGSGQGRPIIGDGADQFEASGTLIKKESNSGVVARVLDDLKNEDKYMLIQATRYSNATAYDYSRLEFRGADPAQANGRLTPAQKSADRKVVPATEVQKVEVQRGSRTTIARVPFANADFTTDHSGELRFATGSKKGGSSRTFYRKNRKSEWTLVNDEGESGVVVSPIGFDQDNSVAYLEYQEASGPNSVYAYDTRTSVKSLLLRDNNVSPGGYLFSPVNNALFGVVFNDGYPRIHYLDSKNVSARALKTVSANFKNNFVLPVSYSSDGNIGLYLVYGDTMPGEYYLYDQSARTLKFLVSKNSWLNSERLAATDVHRVGMRDGSKIEAFVTMPAGADAGKMPLIVYPHDGPFGVFDTWRFNAEVQMLASRGYAVLQLNFRGSGNYGRSFLRAGYRQWGRLMQDDITDATRWAIDEGIAAPNRICLYGSGYGAYAALMGAVKEPDLYRCVIGDIGFYDLPMVVGRGEERSSHSGLQDLEETLGQADLIANSPARSASKITAAVLLLAGSQDDKYPRLQTETMFSELRKAGKQVEMKIYDGEGHGNLLTENKIDHANRVLDFLEKHIGETGNRDRSAR